MISSARHCFYGRIRQGVSKKRNDFVNKDDFTLNEKAIRFFEKSEPPVKDMASVL